jgi:hypothetical protein
MPCMPLCATVASGRLPGIDTDAETSGMTATELEAAIKPPLGAVLQHRLCALPTAASTCCHFHLRSDGTNLRVRHSRVHGGPPRPDRAHRRGKSEDLVRRTLPPPMRARSPHSALRSSDGNFQNLQLHDDVRAMVAVGLI